MEDYLAIYTDGSSAPKPRKGGVGFRMIYPSGKIVDFSPYGYKGATNNEMELKACVLALYEVLRIKDLEGATGVIIFTDSQYIVSSYKTAMFVWPKQKWIRSNGEPVLNATLWKDITRLMKRIGTTFRVYVDFEKVKAHSGIQHNEVVDKLAKRSRLGSISNGNISINNVRKSRTTKKTVKGSIRGEGQRVQIHIVSTQWLSSQKLYRFRCEVLSKKSKYFGNMDFIISEVPMSAGHIYDVILMKDLEYCRIKKVIKEIKKPTSKEI